jgi:hypothetical protein
MIHIGRLKYGSNQLLQIVVVFIAASGAADTGNGIGAVIFDNFLKSGSDQIQSLIPGGLPEAVLFFDKRGFYSLVGIYKVISEAALDAKTSIIGQSVIHASNLDYPIALHVQFQLAAYSAIWAGSSDLSCFPGPGKAHRFFLYQGTHRAFLDALTALYAGGLPHWLVIITNYHGFAASLAES